MTLSSVPFVWVGSKIRQAQREKPIIAWVEERGGFAGIPEDGWLEEWTGGTADSGNLSRTQVSDLSPLAGLKNLYSLYLDDVPVSDLSPLAGLETLTVLYFHNTQVSDLSPLAGFEWLSLDNTQVSDLSPLTGLNNLEWLDLHGTQVSDEQLRVLQTALPECMIHRSVKKLCERETAVFEGRNVDRS